MWVGGVSNGSNEIGLVCRPVKPCDNKDLTLKHYYQELFKDFHIEGRFSKKLELILPEKVLITDVNNWNEKRHNHVNDYYKNIGFWIPGLIQTTKLYLLREVLFHGYTVYHESNSGTAGPTLSTDSNKE